MNHDAGYLEHERRFYCTHIPENICAEEKPSIIIQSYFVHEDNYALRIRLLSRRSTVHLDEETDAVAVLKKYQDNFDRAFMTVKGPCVGGTRYEAEQEIDPTIASQLVFRGGKAIIKNRYNVWLGEDGWNIDIFGGDNYPLIIAEVERSSPVTNLVIPSFCITEITNQARFSNDGLASRPFALWKDEYSEELEKFGAFFLDSFGKNRTEIDL